MFYFRRKWYESTEIDGYFKQDIELTLTEQNNSQAPFCREFNELFTDNTITLFTLLRITRLDILYSEIFVGTLIDVIHHLPNLDSLRIRSLSLLRSQYVSDEQTSHFCLLPNNNNKITKVNIQCLIELVQIQFLIDLCPSMQYLAIGCLNNIDPKLFIKFILTKKFKYISHSCALCFCIQIKNDKMFEELQEMINDEKLCSDYLVKHLSNKIYLQCK